MYGIHKTVFSFCIQNYCHACFKQHCKDNAIRSSVTAHIAHLYASLEAPSNVRLLSTIISDTVTEFILDVMTSFSHVF